MITLTREKGNKIMLPPDVYWPRRVPVKHDGDCLPFQCWVLYAWQHQMNGFVEECA